VSGEHDLDILISSMEPIRRDGRFVLVSVSSVRAMSLPSLATVHEHEAVTAVLRQEDADSRHLRYDVVCGWITLHVHSAIDAVGLTAAFSTALADAGIGSNVLAGYYHDHLLVPIDDVDRALQVLHELADTRRET
jgi:hypothetical protein